MRVARQPIKSMPAAPVPMASRGARRLEQAATTDGSWDPVDSSFLLREWAERVRGIWWTRLGGTDGIAATSMARLEALVRFARSRSPLYREAYRHLPEDRFFGLRQLPVVTRHALMERFDDWVTDREISRAGVEAFLADRAHIGGRFLDRYAVWKSSGTTGEPGIYVQDRRGTGHLRRTRRNATVLAKTAPALCLGVVRERRSCRPDCRDRRPFREHRVVAASLPRKPLARRTRVLRDAATA